MVTRKVSREEQLAAAHHEEGLDAAAEALKMLLANGMSEHLTKHPNRARGFALVIVDSYRTRRLA